MKEYGYQILQALVTDMDPDRRVKEAMNEINASKRLREAATNKAEADKIMQASIILFLFFLLLYFLFCCAMVAACSGYSLRSF